MRSISLLLVLALAHPSLAAIQVPLTVQELAGVDRAAEPVRSGVPIPRSAGLLSTSSLRLTGPAGAVPARFTVTGRWNAGPADATAPIRWLLVDFPATVGANAVASYVLDDQGPGPAAPALVIADGPSDVTIGTGVAQFRVSKVRGSLLDAAWLDLDGNGSFGAGEQILQTAADGGPFVVAGGLEHRGADAAPLSVLLEDAGPGVAVVRVEGFHVRGATPLLRYVTRLTFHAGRSDVRIQHTIVEGRVMGSGNGGYPGGVVETPIDRAGIRLRVALPGSVTATVSGDDATPLAFPLSGAGNASVRQRGSSDWSQPLRYEIASGGSIVESGERAREAWLDLSDGTWGAMVATRDFWRKGPERLLGAADGTIQVELPSEPYLILQGMGLMDDLLLSLHPASTPATTLRTEAQGTCKDPLFAVAPGSWYAQSGALGELRAGASTRYPAYEQAMDASYQATMAWIDEGHAFGLMNWLDMPIDRYDQTADPHMVSWGNSYYDPAGAMLREFARRGELRWLRDVAAPLLRHHYTVDCYDIDDPDHFTNGVSGARGVYHRGAWTGEYHYLESLWDYHYLTGDRRALERGLAAARSYRDRAEWENDYDLGGGVPGHTTRSIGQKCHTLREAYLASGDATMLAALQADAEDLLSSWGTPEQFFRAERTTANPYATDQGFMQSIIYLPVLWEYHDLTGSAAARAKLVATPARILVEHRLSADPGDPAYLDFYNQVEVTATGGGSYTAIGITPNGNSDDYLYEGGVHGLVAALCRASALGGDAGLLAEARTLYEQRTLPRWTGSLLDKPASQDAVRAAVALAYLDPSGGGGSTGDDVLAGLGHAPANANRLRIVTPSGGVALEVEAYAAGAWGVNVGAGDIDEAGGGGDPEILTGPGPGSIFGPQARAFTRTGGAISKVSFFAYGTLRYGVNVAAGELDADGFHEILTGAGPGSVFGPHVRGFDYDGGTLGVLPVSFFAYGTLRYGVNVAAGDVEADGFHEVLTGPGPGVIFGPQVRGFDHDGGGGVSAIGRINFQAFSELQYGALVGAGEVDGDAFDDIVVGPGPGPALATRFRGFQDDGAGAAALPGFDALRTTAYGGRVATADVSGSGPDELVGAAGPDPSAPAVVEAFTYDGSGLGQILSASAFPGSAFGANVSGGAFSY